MCIQNGRDSVTVAELCSWMGVGTADFLHIKVGFDGLKWIRAMFRVPCLVC